MGLFKSFIRRGTMDYLLRIDPREKFIKENEFWNFVNQDAILKSELQELNELGEINAEAKKPLIVIGLIAGFLMAIPAFIVAIIAAIYFFGIMTLDVEMFEISKMFDIPFIIKLLASVIAVLAIIFFVFLKKSLDIDREYSALSKTINDKLNTKWIEWLNNQEEAQPKYVPGNIVETMKLKEIDKPEPIKGTDLASNLTRLINGFKLVTKDGFFLERLNNQGIPKNTALAIIVFVISVVSYFRMDRDIPFAEVFSIIAICGVLLGVIWLIVLVVKFIKVYKDIYEN